MIFKIKIICLICVAFVVYGSQAEQIKHPYFWKVEKDGKTSHLLGTLHEPISIDKLLCSHKIRYHLENSDLVFVEINHCSERSRKAVETQKQWMLSKDGKEFQLLSKKSQEFLKSRGVSERLNFFGYNVVLTNLCAYGVDDIDGLRLDEKITDIAYSKGIPVRELDDFYKKYKHVMGKYRKRADTYRELSNAQFVVEAQLLNQQIDYFFIECPSLQKFLVMESYKFGNGMAVIKGVLDRLTQFQRMWQLEQWEKRNIQWVNRFEEAHQNHDPIFLAGGLGHFVDSVSLINMLKDKGYKVESMFCEK